MRVSRALGRTWGMWVGYTCAVLLTIFVALTVVIPLVTGSTTFTVLSGSMSPGLEPGHLIAVKPVQEKDLKVGDVITYQLESGKPTVVTHRIVGRQQTSGGDLSFVTQGDANDSPDQELVQPIQIRGKLLYAVPYLGRLTHLISPTFKGTVATGFGVGLVAYGIWLLVGGRRKPLSDSKPRSTPGRHQLMIVLAAGVSLTVVNPGLAHGSTQEMGEPVGIEISLDGAKWNHATGRQVVEEHSRLVPGQRVHSTIWVRNTTGHVITASVRGYWASALGDEEPSPSATDLEVSFGSGGTFWQVGELVPGQTQQVPISMKFSPTATGSKDITGQLVFEVTGQQALPPTGFTALPATVWVLGLCGGSVILQTARRIGRPRY